MEEKTLVSFDKKLLDYIKFGEKRKAIKFIKKHPNLVKVSDHWGTLLHYAVSSGYTQLTQFLIKFNSDINYSGQGGTTPLMLAIDEVEEVMVKYLLDAGANIDITNDSGKSALQMAFEGDIRHTPQHFIRRVLNDTSSVEEAAIKLVNAGCNMNHTIYMLNIELFECMLKLGANVNCKTMDGNTPLHTAIYEKHIDSIKWLITNGADVNAINRSYYSPLYSAASIGATEVMKCLLEYGANPNIGNMVKGSSPLKVAAAGLFFQRKEYIECTELLIDYGALLPDVMWEDYYIILDCSLRDKSYQVVRLLLSCLAIFERFGSVIAEPVMRYMKEGNSEEFQKIQEIYKLCHQILKSIVLRNLTLFDLLADSDYKMRYYARNETFLAKIESFCSKNELSTMYPYYFKKLMKRISEAVEIVKLEDMGIPVICRLFEVNYNQGYHFAKEVVGYLNKRDLEKLVLV